MDETLTRVALDVSNRPYLIWKVAFTQPKLGEMDTELFKEWFQAFAQNAGLALHVENLYGENSHHIVETCFKGWRARCARRSRSTRAGRRRALDQGRRSCGSRQPDAETVAIIDYGSGNLRSAAKAFERAAAEAGHDGAIVVTADPDEVRRGRPHRAARRRRLRRLHARRSPRVPGMVEAMTEARAGRAACRSSASASACS